MSKTVYHMKNKGFTLIELMVTVTIMMIMTSVVLFNYNKFNDSTLLNSFAYDMSLTIRQTQVYGAGVREVQGINETIAIGVNTGTLTTFSSPYGVHFDSNPNTGFPFLMFIDAIVDPTRTGNRVYKSGVDTDLQKYTFQRGIKISGICVKSENNSTCNPPVAGSVDIHTLDITFVRPDPEATFALDDVVDPTASEAYIYLSNSDGTITKSIGVTASGQISVQ